jgi:hypothetical protein
MMEDLVPTTCWYVSRRVELPLTLAVDAFDRVVRDTHEGSAFGSLPDGLVAAPALALPGAGRQLHGRLRTARLSRALPVELELTPWSHTQSELGLRPRRRPVGTRADGYWHWAALTLEHLHSRLLAAAPNGAERHRPLRRAS